MNNVTITLTREEAAALLAMVDGARVAKMGVSATEAQKEHGRFLWTIEDKLSDSLNVKRAAA